MVIDSAASCVTGSVDRINPSTPIRCLFLFANPGLGDDNWRHIIRFRVFSRENEAEDQYTVKDWRIGPLCVFHAFRTVWDVGGVLAWVFSIDSRNGIGNVSSGFLWSTLNA